MFKKTVYYAIFQDVFLKKHKIIKFELLVSLLGIFVVYPLMLQLLNLTIKLSPYRVVTKDNILKFLANPLTIIILFIILIIWALYACGRISGICLLFDKRAEIDKLTIPSLFLSSINYAKKIIIPKNSFLLLIIMFILPLFSLFLSIIGFNIIDFPSFILGLFQKKIVVRLGFYLLLFFLTFFFIYTIFIFNFFTIEKMTFFKALKNSIRLVSKNFKKIIVHLLCFNAFILLLSLLIYLLFAFLIAIGIKLLSNAETSFSIFLSVMYIFSTILRFCFKVVLITSNYALITKLFNRYYHSNETIKYSYFRPLKFKKHLKPKTIWTLIIAFLLIFNSLSFYLNLYQGRINLSGLDSSTKITAHRGDSINAPENTLSAIEKAIESGCDFVEVDIQQTKDNEIIVFHDFDLKRICGVNKKIKDLTYQELANYDVGAYFSNEYMNERIPRLEDVLTLCKNKIRLNIEIKNTSLSANFFINLYQLLKEYHVINSVYVSSTNYSFLQTIKQLDDNLTTGYILFFALGNYQTLTNVDFVSLLYANVSLETVKKVHQAGLELHVWTVNNDQDILSMSTIGVDNIITDNPTLTKKIIYTSKSDDLLKRIMYIFFKQEQNVFKLFF